MLNDPFVREGAALLNIIYPEGTPDQATLHRLSGRGVKLIGSDQEHRRSVGLMLIGLAQEGLRNG